MRLLELFERARAAGAVVATCAMLIGCFVGTAARIKLAAECRFAKGTGVQTGRSHDQAR